MARPIYDLFLDLGYNEKYLHKMCIHIVKINIILKVPPHIASDEALRNVSSDAKGLYPKLNIMA